MKMSSPDDVLLMAVWMIIAGWTHCTQGGHSSPHLQEILDSDDLPEVGNCLTAKNACLARRSCRDALVLTMTQCQGVVTNPPEDTGPVGDVVQSFDLSSLPSESDSSSCPSGCQQALASLLSSEAGQELAQCRCGPTQTLCHDIRRRLNASCHQPLHFLLKPSSPDHPPSSPPLSCRMAEAVCNGDTACSLALEYHHVFCRKMFQGQFCSSRCRNSLEVLLNQTYGQALRHCHCLITPADAAYHCRQRYQSHRELCTAGYTLQHPAKGYQYDSEDSLTKNHHYPKGETKGDHQAQEEIMRLVRLEDTAGLQHREPLEEDHALMSSGMDEDDAENIRPLDNAPQRSHLPHNSWPWLTLPRPSAGHSAASRFQPVITHAWPLFLTLGYLHLCLRRQF
ncbi:hypothetical protein RvY_18933 [Ramazzottius varieornatus]|uniref:GDNF/GAS1 domain-containing protein n=1 Tax=Ramazzottius varieornatus TaxID=947166 RepID=A0A1D1WBB8_RAMVA|nr:hypothetical protein RvY_18933 [Ramazzottius varieornatus]